jgi:hypothetical protein
MLENGLIRLNDLEIESSLANFNELNVFKKEVKKWYPMLKV